MSDNPFLTTEAWSATQFLAAGDHVVEVIHAEGSGTTSGGYPQVELELSNADGSIRDWIALTQATVGKVVQIVEALGCEPPQDGDFDPDTLRLSQGYLDSQWRGKRVGILVRAEQDRQDPTKTRDRVKGYVPFGKIGKSDLPNTGVPAARPGDHGAYDTVPF